MTFIYEITVIKEPNTAVAAICLYCVDCFACGAALDALGGYLVARLIGDALAAFERQAVIIAQFENRANVNHNCKPLVCIQ